jgi:hypothetical protein
VRREVDDGLVTGHGARNRPLIEEIDSEGRRAELRERLETRHRPANSRHLMACVAKQRNSEPPDDPRSTRDENAHAGHPINNRANTL